MAEGKTTVAAGFSILRWDETPLIDDDRVRMHATHVEKQFTGDLDGTSVADMIMLYVDGKPAAYCGFERVSGRLGERSGTFVFHHNAAAGIEGGISLTVVPNSGTSELAGLDGSARIKVEEEVDDADNAGASHRIVFEYRLI